MKNILIPTDLSARSDRALDKALNLAKNYDAKLTILHVIDEDNPEILHKDLSKLAKKRIFETLEGKTQGVDYKIEIVVGTPHAKVLQTALKVEADLVILGLHRHTNKNNSMMGKVIERVIKGSLKPVLVVKDPPKSEYKKILVATDFNSHSKNCLTLALRLFPDANFTLMHSYHMPFLGITGVSPSALEDDYRKDCENEMKELSEEVVNKLSKAGSNNTISSYKIKNKLDNGSIIDVLNKEVLYSKPQLLVIGTRGRSGFSKMLSLNVAETFLIDPPCDVLVTF
jgi:nucleotide-binding universal stress UspA family protein